jgi:hypothetical protein
MAWFRKKMDPLSDRARQLNKEIAHLESEIRQLDDRLQSSDNLPSAVAFERSVAYETAGLTAQAAPSQRDASIATPSSRSNSNGSVEAPIFENVDIGRLSDESELGDTRDHYNELGMRKYDLPALLNRLRRNVKAPATTNPKLVNYLAAGGIQGLRPLRYEKRIARRRFFALVTILFSILFGILMVFFHQHR